MTLYVTCNYLKYVKKHLKIEIPLNNAPLKNICVINNVLLLCDPCVNIN